MTINDRNRLVGTTILLLVGCTIFTIVNAYLPGLVQPLVWPLIATAVLVELRRLSNKVTESVQEAAQSTSVEVAELRREIERHNRPTEAKAAGFQIIPDGATVPASASVQRPDGGDDDEE